MAVLCKDLDAPDGPFDVSGRRAPRCCDRRAPGPAFSEGRAPGSRCAVEPSAMTPFLTRGVLMADEPTGQATAEEPTGQATRPAQSIASQSVDDLGGSGSVLVRQCLDHAELDVLLERCRSTTGDEQQNALNSTCRLVFSHAFAEEAVLWPAIRRAVPDGEALTLRIEQEHQEICEVVTELEQCHPGDPRFGGLLERAVELLRQDVRDEEDVVLPQLQVALDAQALRRLGRSWALVRRTAPTRPHPVVSRRPPGNVLAALPLTLIDRSRDVLDRVGRIAPLSVARASRVASRGLAVAAGTIERLPALRRGENPTTRASRTGDLS